MGDRIEVTTVPKYYNVFYHVSSNGFVFEVKAVGFIGIGLSKHPLNSPASDYWIGIGCANDRTWISQSHGENKKEVITPNILSTNEFRSFWISWHNNVIRLGRSGGEEIVACRYDTSKLKYFTFTIVEGGIEPAYWRFDMPPILDTPQYRPITGGDLHWVRMTADSPVPIGAVLGGYEDEPLYIVRAEHSGHLMIGKFATTNKMAYLSYDNGVYEKAEFDILCGYDFTWHSYRSDGDPAAIYVAGYSKPDGLFIHIGRAQHKGHLIPGTMNLHRRICACAFEHKEVLKETCEILIIPETSERSAVNYLISHIPVHDDNRHPLLYFLRHPQQHAFH